MRILPGYILHGFVFLLPVLFVLLLVRVGQDLRRNEPERVRGLGDSVMKELKAFYEEGRMGRLEGLEADPRVRRMELFKKVGWVGDVKARELFDHGITSIEDLRARGQHLLTKQSRVCLSR